MANSSITERTKVNMTMVLAIIAGVSTMTTTIVVTATNSDTIKDMQRESKQEKTLQQEQITNILERTARIETKLDSLITKERK